MISYMADGNIASLGQFNLDISPVAGLGILHNCRVRIEYKIELFERSNFANIPDNGPLSVNQRPSKIL